MFLFSLKHPFPSFSECFNNKFKHVTPVFFWLNTAARTYYIQCAFLNKFCSLCLFLFCWHTLLCWCMEVFLTHRPLGASEKPPVNTQSLTRHFVGTRLCMQAFWDRCLSSDKQYCTADVQRQRWTEYLSLILMLK